LSFRLLGLLVTLDLFLCLLLFLLLLCDYLQCHDFLPQILHFNLIALNLKPPMCWHFLVLLSQENQIFLKLLNLLQTCSLALRVLILNNLQLCILFRYNSLTFLGIISSFLLKNIDFWSSFDILIMAFLQESTSEGHILVPKNLIFLLECWDGILILSPQCEILTICNQQLLFQLLILL